MSGIVFHREVSDSTYYPSSSSSSPVTPGYAPPVVMPISIAPYSAPPITPVTAKPQAPSDLTGRITILTDAGYQLVVMPLPLQKKG